MSPIVRALAGGVGIGAGVAVGAYSGGWFLLLSVLLLIGGIVALASTATRPAIKATTGEPVDVSVDLIDRSSTMWVVSSTLVAGQARPRGDAPFRFQTRSNLSQAQIRAVSVTGEGQLPADAVGAPDQRPQLSHQKTSLRASTVITTVAAIWATIFVPPSGFWDWSPVTTSITSAIAEESATAPKPVYEWFDAALKHVNEVAPDSLDKLLSITATPHTAVVKVYLGGDQLRTYSGDSTGWETTDDDTDLRTRDVFTRADLEALSARTVVTAASAQVPEGSHDAFELKVVRGDDIYGHPHPVLMTAMFGDDPAYVIEALNNTTIAAWWSRGDLAAGMTQIANTLTARGIPQSQQRIERVILRGSAPNGGYQVEYVRDGKQITTVGTAGHFADPDGDPSSLGRRGLKLSDIDVAVLTKVRDDAMRRFAVDPVDRNEADIQISWEYADDDDSFESGYMIEVDYGKAGSALYSLAGTHLADDD